MKRLKQGNLIYLVMWILLFAVPLLGLYLRTAKDADVAFDWMEVVILLIVSLCLAFCVNMGVKSYFCSQDDRRRLAGLEQLLEYLRYHISPNFFMNSLEDIHALVDTDPEKAKETASQLSKMVRYVLYESDMQYVHLYYELEFIQHYVALMQIRHADKVKITLELPDVPNCQIPPLVLFTFVENAFNSCTNDQNEAFVEIKASIEGDKLHFTCCNSWASGKQLEDDACMNLENVRKRLNLLYNQKYSLRIENTPEVYSVELIIHLKSQVRKSKATKKQREHNKGIDSGLN